MSPEVIRNEHVTEKADTWSFGVCLWELLTLEIPYADMEPYSVMWLVARHGLGALFFVLDASPPAHRPSHHPPPGRLQACGCTSQSRRHRASRS